MKKLILAILLLCIPSVAFASTHFAGAGSARETTQYAGGSFQSEVWFYLDTIGSNQGVLGIDQSGASNNNRSFQTYVGTDGSVNSTLFDNGCAGGGITISASASTIKSNTWYYLMNAWDGAKQYMTIVSATGTPLFNASTSATTVCSTAPQFLVYGRITQNIFAMSGAFRNGWFSTTLNTSTKAIQARMFSNNPSLTAPGSPAWFHPFIDGTDSRNTMNRTSTLTLTGTSTFSDPPMLNLYY